MEDLIDLVITILTLVVPLLVGFSFGHIGEVLHYRSIRDREAQFLRIPMATFRYPPPDLPVRTCKLVHGSAVVSADYFRRFIASLRGIIGGRVGSFESILDRGRREALLRMRASAGGSAVFISNVRLETSQVGMNKKGQANGCVEILAYGTAYYA